MDKRLTYLELPASDTRRAAEFYLAVLGWKIEERAEGDFRFADEAANLIGRWIDGRASEPGMVPYFSVERVADAVALVSAHGGEVVAPPRREGDVLVARLRDPAGNVIGVWQFDGRSGE